VASADVGPDLVAPFRAPTILVVYARGPVDLDLSGLVAAGGRGDSNVVVRSPSDSSVFGSDDLTTISLIDETPVRLADPTQMIWDLGQLGGEDRMEAAEVLRKWLLTPR
jgi:hypothetical protein